MSDVTLCEVLVSVAVSDAGITECCIADSNWIQQQRKHKEWMDEKRTSKHFWSIKTVRVNIPMPLQFEDMTETANAVAQRAAACGRSGAAGSSTALTTEEEP